MEKYLELKKILEEFLELKRDLRENNELQESHSLSLLEYLCIINYVIYDEREKFREDFKTRIKEEIKKWSSFYRLGKFDPLLDYYVFFDFSNWNNRKKMEEERQINIKIGKLTRNIKKISTEIVENEIYPF